MAQAVADYQLGANYAFALFGFSGVGAGEMIELFGTDAQKDLFLKKMYTGQWSGTMVLTEPEAGSDLKAIETTLTPSDDGFVLNGAKAFISNAAMISTSVWKS